MPAILAFRGLSYIDSFMNNTNIPFMNYTILSQYYSSILREERAEKRFEKSAIIGKKISC